MELWQLRYFVAVAEEEHVGRAAARLHVSQSPLSRQVRRLEAQLGAELFVREGRRLRLTSLGRDALERARELLARADGLRDHLRSAGRGEAGPVLVGYVQGATYNGTLPRALAGVRSRFPAIAPRLHPLGSREQLAALAAHGLDVAFTHKAPPDRELFGWQLLADEPFVVALPASGASGRDSAELGAAELGGLRWVTPPRARAPGFHERLAAAAARAGFRMEIGLESPDVHAGLAFVAAGLGATLIQESIGQSLPPGVSVRPAPVLGLRLTTGLAWRRADLSRAAACFVQTVVALSGGTTREAALPGRVDDRAGRRGGERRSLG